MWQLRKIEVENFLGFREYQEYIVKNGVAVLIQGINNTDSGADSNGAGKTSFEEIVHYGYLGSASRKGVSDKELIHHGEEKSSFGLQFVNLRDARVLDVKRTISKKSSGTLEILIDNENQKHKYSSVPEGNKYLLSLVGVSQKDFQSYYLINDEKYKPFFTSSDTEKKDFIGRFSNADSVLTAISRVDKKLIEKDKQIEEKQREMSLLEGKLQTYEESLEELSKVDFKSKKESLLERNKSEIQKIKELIIEDEIEFKETTESKNLIKNRLDSIEYRMSSLEKLSYKSKISEIEKEQETIKLGKKKVELEINTVNDDLTFFKKELSGILVELSEVITCPKCKHNFSFKKEGVDKEELEGLKKETEEEIRNLEISIETKTSLSSEKKKELETLLKKLEKFNKKEKRIKTFISELEYEQRLKRKTFSSIEVQGNSLETSIRKNKECLIIEENFSIKKEFDKFKLENELKIKEIQEKRSLSNETKALLKLQLEKLGDEKLEIAKELYPDDDFHIEFHHIKYDMRPVVTKY